MKKIYSLMLTAAMIVSAGFFSSCNDDDDDATITLSRNTLTFGYQGSTETVTVTMDPADVNWTATRPSGDTWLTLTPSGNTLSVKADAWDGEQNRTSTITVTAPGADNKTIAVTQTSEENTEITITLSVDPATLTFAADGTYTNNEVEVTTNADNWSATLEDEDDEEWVTIKEDKANNKFTVTVGTYGETDRDRSAKIIVSVTNEGVADKTVTVNQTKAGTGSGFTNPNFYNSMESMEGTYTVTAKKRDGTNVTWESQIFVYEDYFVCLNWGDYLDFIYIDWDQNGMLIDTYSQVGTFSNIYPAYITYGVISTEGTLALKLGSTNTDAVPTVNKAECSFSFVKTYTDDGTYPVLQGAPMGFGPMGMNTSTNQLIVDESGTFHSIVFKQISFDYEIPTRSKDWSRSANKDRGNFNISYLDCPSYVR